MNTVKNGVGQFANGISELPLREDAELGLAPREGHITGARAGGTGVVADDANAVLHVGAWTGGGIGLGASFTMKGGAHAIGFPIDGGILVKGEGRGGEKKGEKEGEKENGGWTGGEEVGHILCVC